MPSSRCLFVISAVIALVACSFAETVTESGQISNNESSDPLPKPITFDRIAKTVGVWIGVTLAVTLVAPLALSFLCCCIGFTCSGIRANSCAASCQSGIGAVESGSCFSCMQSAGAGGQIGCYVLTGLVFGIPAGIWAGYSAWFYF